MTLFQLAVIGLGIALVWEGWWVLTTLRAIHRMIFRQMHGEEP